MSLKKSKLRYLTKMHNIFKSNSVKTSFKNNYYNFSYVDFFSKSKACFSRATNLFKRRNLILIKNSIKKRIKRLNRIKMKYYDILPLLGELRPKLKFQYIEFKHFIRSRLYFKYTGSNIFVTITNNKGEVAFSYSAGIFKDLLTRTEKTTIFVAKYLGELVALRLYRSNAAEIFFIMNINHYRTRVLIRFLLKGIKLVCVLNFSHVCIRRRVMRNGIRLRKVARK